MHRMRACRSRCAGVLAHRGLIPARRTPCGAHAPCRRVVASNMTDPTAPLQVCADFAAALQRMGAAHDVRSAYAAPAAMASTDTNSTAPLQVRADVAASFQRVAVART